MATKRPVASHAHARYEDGVDPQSLLKLASSSVLICGVLSWTRYSAQTAAAEAETRRRADCEPQTRPLLRHTDSHITPERQKDSDKDG